ncbi:MAG: hypothetical protein QOH86_1569 [Sphingomonadales bacterium]|jgi:hypothetical protein|nr:hypothetical protein [Sphingomonadales bacterium]
MNGIDRRTLIGAGGAALALAGCGSNTAKKQLAPADMAGECADYGDNVSASKPRYGHPTFSPTHLTALYIRFEPTRLILRRGSVVLQNLATQAVTLLEALRTANSATLFYQEDLDDFSMGSQQILLMFIDNNKNYVDFRRQRAGESLNDWKDHIIRFAPLSSVTKKPAQKNYAFYNLRQITLGNNTGWNNDYGYLLDFWNTKSDGSTIGHPGQTDTSKHFRYAMNIHADMGGVGSGKFTRIILDPDTGNMGAQP